MKTKKLLFVASLLTCVLTSCGDGSSSIMPTITDPTTETTATTDPTITDPTTTDPTTPTPIIKHSITWKDELGALLATTEVNEGDIPTYTYDKVDTAEFDYTFAGWSTTLNGTVITSLPAATADTTYFAIMTSIKNKYTITFNSLGGSAVDPITKEYGVSLESPDVKPTKADFHFAGWCTDEATTTPVTWPLTIKSNVTLYAKWNKKVKAGIYLQKLLTSYSVNPNSFIPSSLQAGATSNLITDTTPLDYTNFVDVTNIKSNGLGEQWMMVLDNISQSQMFFNALSVIEGLVTTSVTAFNNYLDNNPSDTGKHNFMSGIYSVTISYTDEIIEYALDYTLGSQTAQIYLKMNILTEVKDVRVQIGEPNAIRYTINKDAYTFAIKYLGIRRAYFSLKTKADKSVEGHINEILTVKDIEVKSAADFYISDKYTSVVGNKASGLIGFTGYITELYDSTQGTMLGYEVKETLTVASKNVTYNTLWFDLTSINGISSIKYLPSYKTETETIPSKLFVNGLSTEWTAKKVGGFGLKMASRRFDIEFRSQYFFKANAENNGYELVELKVPMLFVQVENYDTLINDVKSTNNVTISVLTATTDLDKLQADYASLIDIFIANKDSITSETIIAYIGEKKLFA